MKKVLLALVIVTLPLILSIRLFQTPTTTINGQTFRLTVAADEKEKEVGLSNRTSLPNDMGMIFPFEEEGFHSFWMKGMKFPIDIIFIRDSRIVDILAQVKPPKSSSESLTVYKPKELADAVLEMNSGLSKKYQFKAGDLVTIKSMFFVLFLVP